ncbi:gamma-glutamyl-gamma-aminobutyrate hydrolase family protein [Nocardioides panacisoli]|uniref:gamma-glutamyl-gamma-aminobutyrate hydrolase family protein n=1 Tax=Nocardioides panacisoli TaxID=627624 RepID=UPI001C6363A5|nr:gamma-glutamyl-gamma-aminobutyrate hydrolase family protein [Nocardioides panacisoli]QYJ03080.1 gamma-glutamyl-gamma-aminobutyrate hydrolase family protein [Nocardioides panacisoli]
MTEPPVEGPSILVTAVPSSNDGTSALSTLIDDLAARCAQAIEEVGGHVVWLDLDATTSLDGAVEECDGVLLLGGGDVDPLVYGDTTRHPKLYNVDLRADVVDVGLARAARAAGVPTLAVCRGMHVANVARGGTLVQHLPETAVAHRGADDPMVDHDVHLAAESVLAATLGHRDPRVRSGHHQAVDRIGDGLLPVGWAADGVVEALESTDGHLLAVQWHPEDVATDGDHRRAVFGWLVTAAGVRRHARSTDGGSD